MPNTKLILIVAIALLSAAAPQSPPARPATTPATQPDPLAALREDLYQRGIDTCDQGKYEEALPIHERLTVLDPDYGFGWMGLGWSRQETGDPGGAIEAFKKVFDLGGIPHGRVWLHIAECHVALGDLETAMQDLETAAEAALPGLDRLRARPKLAPLREDERFAARFRELTHDIDPAGLTRQQRWAADLRVLERELTRLHIDPFRHLPREDFTATLRQIEAGVPGMSDEEIQVEIKALMRRIGDGHTWARTPEQSFDDPRAVPVLFGHFADGFFITAADEAHRDLVWARVDRIEGHDPDEVLQRLDRIVSCDNAMRLLSQGPFEMRFPGVLKGLGIAGSADELRLGVTDATGARREVVLTPGPAPEQWSRTPPSAAGAALPIHMRRRAEYYWFERLEDAPVIYFQYNACALMEGRPLEALAEDLVRAADDPGVEALIIDLRWNGGGNLFISRPLLAALLRSEKLAEPGRLYVIAGRHTFSAAMVFAALLERHTPAIFVGEPTGSSPNFTGETNLVTLPCSRMIISVSNLAWQNSHAMDNRPWIPPRLRAPMHFEAWKQGRDEALELILRHVQERRASAAPAEGVR